MHVHVLELDAVWLESSHQSCFTYRVSACMIATNITHHGSQDFIHSQHQQAYLIGMLGNDQQELHDIVIKHACQKFLAQSGPVVPS